MSDSTLVAMVTHSESRFNTDHGMHPGLSALGLSAFVKEGNGSKARTTY